MIIAQKPLLYWASTAGRMGWWILFPSGIIWPVFGPSICTSSGGGPSRAMECLRELGVIGDVDIQIPSHKPYLGEICQCQEHLTSGEMP